jgi:hypothetical protein
MTAVWQYKERQQRHDPADDEACDQIDGKAAAPTISQPRDKYRWEHEASEKDEKQEDVDRVAHTFLSYRNATALNNDDGRLSIWESQRAHASSSLLIQRLG